MVDLIAVAVLVLLVIRGWVRGFVREAIDVATLVLGAILAFRLAPLVGRLVTGVFGWSPEPARILGGAAIFVVITIGAAFAGSAIHRALNKLPGTSLLNHVAGAGLGAVYAAVLAIVAVTLVSAVPLPAVLSDELEDSVVAARIIDPDGPAQRAVGAISGDRALQSMIWIRRMADDWRVVVSGGADIRFPSGGGSGARPSAEATDAVADAIDSARALAGLDPLRWEEQLSLVAVTRAGAIYRSGSFVDGQTLEARLAAAGVTASDSEELLVLAPTLDRLGDSVDPKGDGSMRAGVGVVDGPYGLLAVLVLVTDA